MEVAVEMPQTCCSHRILVDFLEYMFLCLSYALRAAPRDFRLSFFKQNSFCQLHFFHEITLSVIPEVETVLF